MPTTGNTLIEETLRLLHTGGREEQNKLAAAITTTSEAIITCTYVLAGIQEGSVLCIDTELLYVWTTNPTSKTVTLERGWRGSTAATHAVNALIQVNPRFSRFDIFTALNQDLDDLSANGLYQVKTVDLTYDASVQGYNLTSVNSNLLEIIEVKHATSGKAKSWPTIPPNHYRLKRDSVTTDFASGLALVLYKSARPGYTIRVSYKAPFTLMASPTSDLQSTCGLPATANDLPPMGAGLRLTNPREVRRNFDESQGDTRRPDEVPAGANTAASRSVAAWRRERIEREKERLAVQYPDHARV